jgi:hypothetical protein
MMSRLPQDPAYWETLTDRMVAAAHIKAPGLWSRGIARLATPLVIGAAVAVIAALMWRPDIARPVQGARPALYGIVPSDPLAAPFVTSAVPPTMAMLIAIPISGSTQ